MDRTWRNPNLLVWHDNIWLIDHGSALYFQHNWPTARPLAAFDAKEHVLRPAATRLGQAHQVLAPRITEDLLDEVVGLVRLTGSATAGPRTMSATDAARPRTCWR